MAEQTLRWVAAASVETKFESKAAAAALHKTMLPALVKCADGKVPEVRAAALDAIAGIAFASGGLKALAKFVDGLDDAKKLKIQETCVGFGGGGGGGGGGGAEPLSARDPNAAGAATGGGAKQPSAAVRSSVSGSLSRPGTSTSRPGSGASTVRKSTTSLASTPGAAKPASAAAAAAASSEAEAEVNEGPPASKVGRCSFNPTPPRLLSAPFSDGN